MSTDGLARQLAVATIGSEQPTLPEFQKIWTKQDLRAEHLMRASDAMVDGLLAEHCDSQGLFGSDVSNASYWGVLLPAQRRRLSEAKKAAVTKGLATSSDDGLVWHAAAAFTCLDQEGSFAAIRTNFPRLFRNTFYMIW